MPRPVLLGSALLGLVVLVVVLVVIVYPSEGEAVPDYVEGDAVEVVERIDPEAMPREAAAFLATDRPWRAAQVMRRYLNEAPDAPARHRLLAARAEAGWGGWAEVHALLDDLPALETLEEGIGLYLLGRARDERGDATGAVEAYRAFLALPDSSLEAERAAARLRLGLALVRAGDREGARPALAASAERLGNAAVWLDLLEADALAATGDAEAVEQAVAPFDSGLLGLRAWRARIEAARQSGIPGEVRRLAAQARVWAGTDATRAEFLLAEGRAALDMNDAAAGRALLRGAISRDAAGPHGLEAADLLRDGTMNAADHLAVARVLRAQGLHEEALAHYRAWLDADQGAPGERARVQLEYADALFYAEHFDEVEAALDPVASQTEARRLRARTASQLGDADEAERLYLQLAEERGAGEALLRYLAADAQHHAGNMERARALYRQVVSRHAGSDLMGLSLMRLAGMAFLEEDYAEAARIWDGYRSRYPRGSRALQATYWAGRAREAMGDSTEAAALFRAVRQRDRDSYYALLAGERLGRPFWPLPMGVAPPDDPAATTRVAGWMRSVDLLREAGFPDEASDEASRIVANVGSDRATRYALAEALIARGYSQRAIRLGFALQGSGPPNRRLYRILYPFPYRTLIEAEATERGFDPFIAAALIRQESMFEARITSHVGARGLMQIMPATGRDLAEAAGIERWDPEVLYHPEINVHLGTRYVAQHLDDFDGSLPSVFAAYNAGEHRVEWWSAYPEYGEPELFTERIPYRETRDYVKILTRNRALYQGLYGEGD